MSAEKILVRVPQWLGDAVVSTVFLTRLKNRHPDAEISVLVPSPLAPVFETHPSVGSVIPIDSARRSPWAVASLVSANGFDVVYILPRSFRTALEAKWAGIPRRIGFSGDFRALLLTTAVPPDDRLLYAHRYLKLIGEETFPLDQAPPYFPSSDSLPLLRGAVKPILGLAPASVAPARTWNPERFADVANLIQAQQGGTVVLFGSARERATTAFVRDRIRGPVIDTAGQLSLPELGSVMRNCDALVANDSGLMHVASCFRVPTVVLFGPSDPLRALPPWGHFIAIHHKEVACVPCLRNECVRFGTFKYECMKVISTIEVMESLQKLIKRT